MLCVRCHVLLQCPLSCSHLDPTLAAYATLNILFETLYYYASDNFVTLLSNVV